MAKIIIFWGDLNGFGHRMIPIAAGLDAGVRGKESFRERRGNAFNAFIPSSPIHPA